MTSLPAEYKFNNRRGGRFWYNATRAAGQGLADAISGKYNLPATPAIIYEIEDYVALTFNNLQRSDEWNFNALETINRNIVTQHSEMRQHLQDRHQDMTDDIVEFIEESTNTVSGYFTLQSDWLHENLCAIYENVADSGSCSEPQESLLGVIGASFWDKMLRIEKQGESLSKEIRMALAIGNVGGGEDGMDGAQSLLQIGNQTEGLESIRAKIDAMEGSVQECGGKMEAMEGKMEDMKDAMDGKMNAMDGKIGAVDGKISAVEGSMHELGGKMDAMEGKMDAMEGKIDAMEGKLEDMKEVMKQLVDHMMGSMDHDGNANGVH